MNASSPCRAPGDRHVAPGRRVLECVLDQVVEARREVIRASDAGRRPVGRARDVMPLLLRPAAPARQRVVGGSREIDRLAGRGGRIRRGQPEEIRDEPREAHGLGLRSCQLLADGRVVGGHVGGLDAQAEAREGRPQLVRRVGHERALRLQRIREPVGHRVEGPGDLALLRRALDHRACLQIAASHPAARSPRDGAAAASATRRRTTPRRARTPAPAAPRRSARTGLAGSPGRSRRRSGSRGRRRRSCPRR